MTTTRIAIASALARRPGAAGRHAGARQHGKVLRRRQGRQERLPDRQVLLRRHVEDGCADRRLDLGAQGRVRQAGRRQADHRLITVQPIRTVAGIGLRSPHLAEIARERPATGFLEIHAENYLAGSPALQTVERLRSDYALSIHAVGLSLGSVDGLDEAHLARVARLVKRLAARARCRIIFPGARVGGRYFNDLLPLPYTEEALGSGRRATCSACRRRSAGADLGREPVLLLWASRSRRMSEPDVPGRAGAAQRLRAVARRQQPRAVTAHNLRLDRERLAAACPARRSPSTHLAGHAGERRRRRADPDRRSRQPREGDGVWTLFADGRRALRAGGRRWSNGTPTCRARCRALLDEAAARIRLNRVEDRRAPLALRDLQEGLRPPVWSTDRAATERRHVVGDAIPAAARLRVHRHHVLDSLADRPWRPPFPRRRRWSARISSAAWPALLRRPAHCPPSRCWPSTVRPSRPSSPGMTPRRGLPYLGRCRPPRLGVEPRLPCARVGKVGLAAEDFRRHCPRRPLLGPRPAWRVGSTPPPITLPILIDRIWRGRPPAPRRGDRDRGLGGRGLPASVIVLRHWTTLPLCFSALPKWPFWRACWTAGGPSRRGGKAGFAVDSAFDLTTTLCGDCLLCRAIAALQQDVFDVEFENCFIFFKGRIIAAQCTGSARLESVAGPERSWLHKGSSLYAALKKAVHLLLWTFGRGGRSCRRCRLRCRIQAVLLLHASMIFLPTPTPFPPGVNLQHAHGSRHRLGQRCRPSAVTMIATVLRRLLASLVCDEAPGRSLLR